MAQSRHRLITGKVRTHIIRPGRTHTPLCGAPVHIGLRRWMGEMNEVTCQSCVRIVTKPPRIVE